MSGELWLKNVQLDGVAKDIYIQNGRFATIVPGGTGEYKTTEVLECRDLAILPPFYNLHTHAAMTLLRGYADDMELFEWLSKYIWPAEANLTREDVYAGSRLAILEMIKTGTVFFNDMYWYQLETVRAAEEMGIRMAAGVLNLSESSLLAEKLDNCALLERRDNFSDLIRVFYAPHAIYTVREAELRQIARDADKSGLPVHIHVSETNSEVENSLREHGLRPVEYLDNLGLLNEQTILAHAVHLDERELKLIAERESIICRMPTSNAKLASGYGSASDRYKYGCRVTMGTDGASSNNNLSMLESMKIAALFDKDKSGDPALSPADLLYQTASRFGAEALGLQAGVIQEGYLADALLVKLNHHLLTPAHHLISNMVYSADSSVIDSVICNGRVIMKHGIVPGEAEILAQARACAKRVTQ